MTASNLPLSGVRVLDLSRLLPGAFCTHMLRELGASVTKVEPPGGDPLRRLAPIARDGNSAFHHLLNQGKESIEIDLRRADGRARLDALLASHDVLVDNFRAATAKRLGLDRDAIRAAHPHLIHCSITGYGQDSPDADRAGHDINFVAEAGLLSFDVTGRREPSMPRMFIADVGGGAMSAVIGILAALVGRGAAREVGQKREAEQTPEVGQTRVVGTHLDVSMHHASLYWLMLPAARLLVKDVDPAAPDLPTDGSFACYNVYECADGKWIALGALEEHFWARFCERLGKSEWAPLQYDSAAQPAIIGELRTLVGEAPRDSWLELFRDLDICLSPVRDPAEALAAAGALAARGSIQPPWRFTG